MKFGWIPGGGCEAGIVFSTAAGMLSMTFGSILLVDMISNDECFVDDDNSDFTRRGSLSIKYM